LKASSTSVGVVVSAQGSLADVSTSRGSACTGCSEASTCTLPDPEACVEIVTVRNAVGAEPGDTVELDLPQHGLLRLSLLVWVVPLLGMVAGAIVGTTLPTSSGLVADAAAFLGAVSGAALAFGVLRWVDRRAAGDPRLTPFVARILRRVSR
jgi:sigma-E factor negative regulatory protein RseC